LLALVRGGELYDGVAKGGESGLKEPGNAEGWDILNQEFAGVEFVPNAVLDLAWNAFPWVPDMRRVRLNELHSVVPPTQIPSAANHGPSSGDGMSSFPAGSAASRINSRVSAS
jgi:hypothetical protein